MTSRGTSKLGRPIGPTSGPLKTLYEATQHRRSLAPWRGECLSGGGGAAGGTEQATAMAFWQARDFLFCGVCGTLLTFESVHSASCPLCGFKRDAKGLFPPPPHSPLPVALRWSIIMRNVFFSPIRRDWRERDTVHDDRRGKTHGSLSSPDSWDYSHPLCISS